MSRSIHRLLSSSAALAMLLAFGVLAAGCAGNPAALADIRYDFGPPNPAASAGTLPAVKVLEVSAPDNLESDKLIYRLSYADAQQTASYANSHWTMAPSQLLTQRLRGALSSRGTVLTGADGVRAPVLKVDLSRARHVDAKRQGDQPAHLHRTRAVQFRGRRRRRAGARSGQRRPRRADQRMARRAGAGRRAMSGMQRTLRGAA
jgi:uncharacterized lipoprotein YmbA